MKEQKTERDSTNVWKYFVGGTIVIIGLLVGFFFMMQWNFCKWDERGQFGDQFGAVNALFSGLAFLGLILTIGFQSRDIKLQREDLRLQTEALQLQIQEFKEQKEEMRKSADAQVVANLLSRRKMEMDILKARFQYATARYDKSMDPSSIRASSEKINTIIEYMEKLVESPLL